MDHHEDRKHDKGTKETVTHRKRQFMGLGYVKARRKLLNQRLSNNRSQYFGLSAKHWMRLTLVPWNKATFEGPISDKSGDTPSSAQVTVQEDPPWQEMPAYGDVIFYTAE